MKIAVSAREPSLESQVDPRFGRAAHFVIVDTESGEHEVIENSQNLGAAQGAGIQSAQAVIQAGAQALLTGNCGPKAFRVLQSANVQIFVGVDGTLEEVLDRFKAGELEPARGQRPGTLELNARRPPPTCNPSTLFASREIASWK